VRIVLHFSIQRGAPRSWRQRANIEALRDAF